MKKAVTVLKDLALSLIASNLLVIRNGEIVYVDENGVESSDAADLVYDSDGLSHEMTEFGGVRLKEIDELYAKKLASGDPKWERVLRMQSSHFCFVSPNREYPENILNQLRSNQAKNWMVSSDYNGETEPFYEMGPRYTNRITKEVLFRALTNTEIYSRQWIKHRKQRLIRMIPDHITVAKGNFSDPMHPQWQEEFRNKILSWVESDLQYAYDHIDDVSPYGPKT